MADRIFVGVDTGASRTRIAWDTKCSSFDTPPSYEAYVPFLGDELNRLGDIERIVVALPTVIVDQVITEPTIIGPGWDRANLQEDLRKHARVRDIVLMQDTEAAGYGVLDKMPTTKRPALLITLSSGVGGALLTQHGVLPLEAGHMILDLSGFRAQCACKQFGCVEADLSGTRIELHQGIDTEDAPDEFWHRYGELLGRYFGALAPLFMTKEILLMGGLTEQSAKFLPRCEKWISENVRRMRELPSIRVISEGDTIGAYGALVMAQAGPGRLSGASR